MTVCCPTCHRPYTEERLGIRLTPIKARLFDSIKATGDIGVTVQELFNDHYQHRHEKVQPSVIKSHINQLNDMLVETRYQIVMRYERMRWHGDAQPTGNKKEGRYLLVRR